VNSSRGWRVCGAGSCNLTSAPSEFHGPSSSPMNSFGVGEKALASPSLLHEFQSDLSSDKRSRAL
jgi:hypothetical protein